MIDPHKTPRVARYMILSLLSVLLSSHLARAQDRHRGGVTVLLPDLVVKVADIRIRPQTPRVGEDVNIEAVILNLGRAGTRSKILCALSTVDRTTTRLGASEQFDAQIGVNRSHVVHWKVKMPRGREVWLYVGATIESGPPDANENNNWVRVAVKADENRRPEGDNSPPVASVRVTPPSFPDLVLTNDEINIDPPQPRPHQRVTIWAGLRNVGTADANVARIAFSVFARRRLIGEGTAEGAVPADTLITFHWSFEMPESVDGFGIRVLKIKAKATTANDANTHNQQVEKLISIN